MAICKSLAVAKEYNYVEHDILKTFAALEHELEMEQRRPNVWEDVACGRVPPPDADGTDQLERDRALFQPLRPARREEILDRLLQPTTGSRGLRHRVNRGFLFMGGLAAAASVALYLSREPPGTQEPIVDELPAGIPASIEVVGGLPTVRTEDVRAADSPFREIPADRRFKLRVRIEERSFVIHQLLLRCPDAETRLTFTPLVQQTGFVEADVDPPGSATAVCLIDAQLRDGDDVFRLPGPSVSLQFQLSAGQSITPAVR